jgi:hypothetical protein
MRACVTLENEFVIDAIMMLSIITFITNSKIRNSTIAAVGLVLL